MAKRYKRFTESLTWNPVHGSLGRLPAKALEQVLSKSKSPLTVTHANLVRQSCVTRSVISIERSPMEREHPNSLGRHRHFWRSPLTWCLLLRVHKQRNWHDLTSLHGKIWHGKLFSLAVAWVALANSNWCAAKCVQCSMHAPSWNTRRNSPIGRWEKRTRGWCDCLRFKQVACAVKIPLAWRSYAKKHWRHSMLVDARPTILELSFWIATSSPRQNFPNLRRLSAIAAWPPRPCSNDAFHWKTENQTIKI